MTMQKIFYEKEIDLLHQLKELVSLTVDESIDYKIEDHGVRAVGSLAIKGEYISQEKRHFLENVELDVYADDQKIIDRQDFHLKVEDFHYDIIDGNLKIKIEVGVYGVEEGENRYIQLDEDPIDEIEKLSRDVETQTINEQIVAEAPEEIQDVEKLQEKIYETKEKEEKVDDDEDLGVYYLYVVLPNDTYASIARQYQVDEKMIRDYNQDLNLDAGQILIIPYAPKDHSNKV
jgi:LysM repeat protein